MTVRTRFAPSPTGYLHIGGARTALFNYLFARKHKGKFILRIEDTDVERSTEESAQAILDGMAWLGLDYDEGPFYQSERLDVYREFAKKLLDSGRAYRCFCTPDELKERRENALKDGRPSKYDGRCRGGAASGKGPSALRFAVEPGKTVFNDLIKGTIAIDHSEIEDFVILRSDDTSTYNFCVVVDDAEMAITHNIRGDDHINNTPKQILLYSALGYPLPEFAHLPMILGADKTRLSKRHGATSVMAYKEMGYLPEALINYLARLGWSCGDEEIFSMSALVEKFSLESVGKSSGVFNPEKLAWLNQHYIKESSNERLAGLIAPLIAEAGLKTPDACTLAFMAGTLKGRAKTVREMFDSGKFYFIDDVAFDEAAVTKFLTQESADILKAIMEGLTGAEPFNEASIEAVFSAVMAANDMKLGKLAQPVRVALTGSTVSPGIFETIAALGKDKTIGRLRRALERVEG